MIEYIDRIDGRDGISRKPDQLRVYFRDHAPLDVTLSTWVELGLKVGLEITANDLAELEVRSKVAESVDRALRYLALRPRTTQEIRSYLRKRDIDEDVIRRALAQLEDRGLLNDTEYVRGFVQERGGSMSRRELSWRLEQRGLERALIVDVLDEELESLSEHKSGMQCAEKYFRSHRSLPMKELRVRLMAYMNRKGYSYEVIRQCVAEVLHDSVEGDLP